MRLIILMFMFYLAWNWYKLLRPKSSGQSSRESSTPPRNFSKNAELDAVLKSCPVCGTFFHEKQGVYKSSQWVCSPACAENLK